jgi:isoleucyl-tRNA synthetase
MHVLGVALTNKNSFSNAVTSGVIAGTDGRKMSKTYGNYPDPKETLEKYGAEAMRWYFLTSKLLMGEDIKLDEKEIRDQLRLYLLPLWNIYSFFVTYAQIHDWQPNPALLSNKIEPGKGHNDTYWYKVPFNDRHNKLDKWIITVLQKTIHDVRTELDNYFIPKATRLLEQFTDTLSRGYIRRSRNRFNSGDEEAFETLYYVLIELIKLTAPFTPFIAEEIFQNLVKELFKDQSESVHLTDYPEADMEWLEQNTKLLSQMQALQEIIDLGQSIRTQNNLKLRQPLASIEVQLNTDSNQDLELKNWMKTLIAQELNVQAVTEKHGFKARKDWITSTNDSKNISISLDTNLTPQLKQLGLYRELVRFVQASRKKQGLNIGQKISLRIQTDNSDLQDMIKKEQIKLGEDVAAEHIDIEPIAKDASTENIIRLNNIEIIIMIDPIQ